METAKTDDVLQNLRERATALLTPRARPTTSKRVDVSPVEDYVVSDDHTMRKRRQSGTLVRVSTRDQQEREQLRNMVSSAVH
jgi:hypothetical protein